MSRIVGVDVSSLLSLEESGVRFFTPDGVPGDLLAILAEVGVTDVRVRVWNDPFDAQGRGYGGGNVDVARAAEIGRRATALGMRVLVNFHYSDFWADPARQYAPKAWRGLDAREVATAVGDFTADALTRFAEAGVDVGIVQVGNETNEAVAGVTDWAEMCAVFAAGSAAVRRVLPEALVALHFTNPEEPGRYERYAATLAEHGVDYDVFASSYYAFWHGTLPNLTRLLSHVATTYGKQVMVAETSWTWTLADGDGSENAVTEAHEAYPATVEGQAQAWQDVHAAVAAVGPAGLGAFYWEPAWLPVGPPEQREANAELWDRHGSGWMSSFAADYDPTHRGFPHPGSSWDNQAWFDFTGHPHPTLARLGRPLGDHTDSIEG